MAIVTIDLEKLGKEFLKLVLVREYLLVTPVMVIDKEDIEKQAVLLYHNDPDFHGRVETVRQALNDAVDCSRVDDSEN